MQRPACEDQGVKPCLTPASYLAVRTGEWRCSFHVPVSGLGRGLLRIVAVPQPCGFGSCKQPVTQVKLDNDNGPAYSCDFHLQFITSSYGWKSCTPYTSDHDRLAVEVDVSDDSGGWNVIYPLTEVGNALGRRGWMTGVVNWLDEQKKLLLIQIKQVDGGEQEQLQQLRAQYETQVEAVRALAASEAKLRRTLSAATGKLLDLEAANEALLLRLQQYSADYREELTELPAIEHDLAGERE